MEEFDYQSDKQTIIASAAFHQILVQPMILWKNNNSYEQMK